MINFVIFSLSYKKIMKKLLILVIVAASVISCSKEFEEGGSIKNAEEVLTKEWSMEKAFKNGSLKKVISANPQIGEVTEDWKFNVDGTCTTEDGNSTLSGTWALSDDGLNLTVTITTPTSKASVQTYSIVKLTEGTDGQMIWEQIIDADEYRYELRSSS